MMADAASKRSRQSDGQRDRQAGTPKRNRKGDGQRSVKAAALDPNAATAPTMPLTLPSEGVEINGSMLEGGGQILRNAAALGAIGLIPIQVNNIRAGRDKPGLRPQHLAGLQLIASVSSGTLQGGAVGSKCIVFTPGRLRCADHVCDTRTAGSCMLLAQAAIPCLLMAAPGAGGNAVSHLELRGGTDAAMAQPVGYMQHVLLPLLQQKFGLGLELQLERRGFFPKGQGIVHLTVPSLPVGSSLPALNLTERGEVTRISVHAFSAGRVIPTVAERLAAAAQKEVKSRLGTCGVSRSVPLHVEAVHEPAEHAFGDGCTVVCVAETSTGCLFGSSGLGERGVPAENIGARAGNEVMDAIASGACTDEWLQDQLIIFMALAKGTSMMLTGEPTLHTRTAIAVAEQLTAARFEVLRQQQGGLWKVVCHGAGQEAGRQQGSVQQGLLLAGAAAGCTNPALMPALA